MESILRTLKILADIFQNLPSTSFNYIMHTDNTTAEYNSNNISNNELQKGLLKLPCD